jgi:hypothetical protein
MNGTPGNAATVVTAAALLMNCLLLNFMSSPFPLRYAAVRRRRKKTHGADAIRPVGFYA